MKRMWILLGVGVLGAALSACNKTDTSTTTEQAPTSSEPASAPLVVRIATESNFKPFSYLDSQGNLVGFEIDLANAMCQQMQATCEISSQDWDSLIPALNAGKFDAVMAAMSVTDERKQVLDFSTPYFYNSLVLVGKKGDTTTIANVDGKTIGVQIATTSASYLADNHPQAVVKVYDKQDNAYLDLNAGRIDYMLSDFVPMSDWLKSDMGQGFEIKGDKIDIQEEVAVAIKKGDTATLERFNTALATLKSNGEYDKLVAKYFEVATMDSATTAPAEQATTTQ